MGLLIICQQSFMEGHKYEMVPHTNHIIAAFISSAFEESATKLINKCHPKKEHLPHLHCYNMTAAHK